MFNKIVLEKKRTLEVCFRTLLNDLKKTGDYHWITTDGSDEPKYDWTFWSDGLDPVGHKEPSTNADKRCTYALFSDHLPGDYGTQGKWVKGKCENEFKFVCSVDSDSFVQVILRFKLVVLHI